MNCVQCACVVSVMRVTTKHSRIVAALVAPGLLAAACSSGGGSPSTAGNGNSAPSGSSAVTIKVSNGHLTDATGRTVYLWRADKTSKSTCNGNCTTFWQPVTAKSKATAGTGANAADLGTSKRNDGTTQITYSGHPLYYYSGDSGPGQTNGQGNNGFGALWWEVAPTGTAITTGGQSNSGGGYGY